MSELKAYRVKGVTLGDTHDVYLKSEADKVIAEKDEEIRRQKYKRCLSMAKWCDAEADVADADGDYEDMRWYQTCHKRWLAIAEKFKPNKEAKE